MANLTANLFRGACRRAWLTFDVVGVVDDKVVVPHHGEIHREVADVIAFVGILKPKGDEARLKLFMAGFHLQLFFF